MQHVSFHWMLFCGFKCVCSPLLSFRENQESLVSLVWQEKQVCLDQEWVCFTCWSYLPFKFLKTHNVSNVTLIDWQKMNFHHFSSISLQLFNCDNFEYVSLHRVQKGNLDYQDHLWYTSTSFCITFIMVLFVHLKIWDLLLCRAVRVLMVYQGNQGLRLFKLMLPVVLVIYILYTYYLF